MATATLLTKNLDEELLQKEKREFVTFVNVEEPFVGLTHQNTLFVVFLFEK